MFVYCIRNLSLATQKKVITTHVVPVIYQDFLENLKRPLQNFYNKQVHHYQVVRTCFCEGLTI